MFQLFHLISEPFLYSSEHKSWFLCQVQLFASFDIFRASVIYLLAVFLSSFSFFFSLSLSLFFRRTRYCTQIGWTSWRTRTQFIVPADYEKRRDKYIRFKKRRDACRMAVACSEARYRKYSIWYFRRLRHIRLRWAGNRVHGWCTLDTGMRQNWFSGKSSQKTRQKSGISLRLHAVTARDPHLSSHVYVFERKNGLTSHIFLVLRSEKFVIIYLKQNQTILVFFYR